MSENRKNIPQINKRLPIGIQTFSELIEGSYLYVEKTALLAKNLQGRKGYSFLSRPRRFGKTLFLDILKGLFEGIFSGSKEEHTATELC